MYGNREGFCFLIDVLYLLFLECNTFIMTDVVFDGETTITLNLICISSCVCVCMCVYETQYEWKLHGLWNLTFVSGHRHPFSICERVIMCNIPLLNCCKHCERNNNHSGDNHCCTGGCCLYWDRGGKMAHLSIAALFLSLTGFDFLIINIYHLINEY